MCGDSTNENDIFALMEGKKYDLLVTDPPYNVDYESADGQTIQNDNMNSEKFKEFLVSAFKNANEYLKEGSSFYVWYASRNVVQFMEALEEVGLNVKQELIWNKNALVLGRSDYHWKHEPCLYGWKEGAGHHWYGDRTQTTVMDFDKPKRNDLHPTMKPVDLIAYLIRQSSKEKQKVVDIFGGSGTTLIACEELNRKCYMVEIDPKYVEVIINRWEMLTGKKAQLIRSAKAIEEAMWILAICVASSLAKVVRS